MIPLHDTNQRNSFPFINYFIILSNIAVFILQLSAPDFEAFILAHAFVPAQFSLLNPASWFTVISSMWMHGNLLHIIFNLWFLHIFGDNVEDRIGHIRYLLFYVVCGIAAVGAQYVIEPSSTIPLIGASGAIAGVTGAYLKLFKDARIVALVPSFFGILHRVVLPSWIFLGYWFLLQVVSGFGSLATLEVNQGGVAFFAHIGGFIAGYFLAFFVMGQQHDSGEDDTYEKLKRLYN